MIRAAGVPPAATSTGTRIEPSAKPAPLSASDSANTRAMTEGGGIRWSSVRPPTSTSVLPAPATANSASAAAVVEWTRRFADPDS